MCGIAGIFAYHYAASPVNRDELTAMRDYMWKRGPDGQGEWHHQNQRLSLGHRRLAIIDLSEKGRQPMASFDKQCVITFNGEIYNYQSLRADLIAEGAQFSSNSDTEVILQLYQRHGIEMLKMLRGMFAFALWDEQKQALLLARDPYGIKPLYYADDGWTMRFASQVKALLTSKEISKTKSAAGQVGFYLFGSIPEPHTLYEDIRLLPAGHYAWVKQTGTMVPQQYFSLARTFSEAQQEQASIFLSQDIQSIASQAFKDSVQHHLVADVPVGAFLSSGIDSGALVGIIKEFNHSLQTLTLTFDSFINQVQDEAPLAKKLAEFYQVQHHTYVLEQSVFKQNIEQMLLDMDQPSVDGLNTWLISKAAAELGLKVVVSGLGGDELLGGYPSFRNLPRWHKTLGALRYLPGFGQVTQSLFIQLLGAFKNINPKLAGLVRYSRSLYHAYFLQRGLFMPWELKYLLDLETIEHGLQKLDIFTQLKQALIPEPPNDFAKIACLESSFYMRNQLLRDSDWASMAHSLELRVPLVDSVLLKNLASVLLASQTNKHLLAKAPTTPLPTYITERKKTGFTIPIQQWLEEDTQLNQWRSLPFLQHSHWSRKFAYSIMSTS